MANREFTNVKFYVDWTAAQTRENILTGAKTGDVNGEALATSFGKISKWFTDIEATGLFNADLSKISTYAFANGTDGSFTVTPTTGGTEGDAQTVRVLPSTTASDEGKLLQINASGAPVWNDVLANYYARYNATTANDKTATTYNAQEIDALVAPKLAIQIVTELPTTDISKTTIYLKPVSGTGTTNNVYEEWVYINNGTADVWEKLGVQEIDLAGFLKAANVQTGSTFGTIKVKGEGDNTFTDVAVYGIDTAAGKSAATGIVTDTEASGYNANSDAAVPTVKAVVDYVGTLDTGVVSVNATSGQTTVDQTTGAVTVGLADTAVTAGSYGQSSTVTPDATTKAATFNVPNFTVDAKGRLTAAADQEVVVQNNATAQTAITDGENKFFPVLFGATGAASATSGAISTSTETDGVKKTGRMYVKVDANGVTKLHADVFEGLAATQAAGTNDNTLASTAFVQQELADALNNKLVEGSGIDLTYDSTNKTTTIAIDNTVTADTTGAFAKLAYNAQGLITGATAVAASDITDLIREGASPSTEKYLSNDGTWKEFPTATINDTGIVRLNSSVSVSDTDQSTAVTPKGVADFASANCVMNTDTLEIHCVA